jgi:acetyl esterase/lipase
MDTKRAARRVAPIAWVLLLGIAAGVVAQPQSPPRRVPWWQRVQQRRGLPKGTQVLRDLEYAKVEGKSLKLDLYLPPREAGRRLPLVVWIHGGAWRGGSKNRTRATCLLPAGYAVASISYRFSQEAIFPAQIHDCKAAIRWLRAHGDKYALDTKRIGVWGSSAGGHLVALLGTSGGVQALEGTVGGNLDQSSRVQAVCDFCGPSDFMAIVNAPSHINRRSPNAPESRLLGGPPATVPERARQASPVTHATADDPPFMTVHGARDRTVPPSQATRLHEVLRKAGVPSELHMLKNVGHGIRAPGLHEKVRRFFDKHVKAAKPATRPAPVPAPETRPRG